MEGNHSEEHAYPESERLPGLEPWSAPASLLPTVLANLGLGNERLPKGSSLETIVMALRDPTWQVRAAAVRALADCDQSVGAPFMAPTGLSVGTPFMAPTGLLEQALHDPEWRVRTVAVQVLGSIESLAHLELLTSAMQDEDRSVRAAAVQALSKLGKNVPVDQLRAGLQDPEWLVRETAAAALGKLGELAPAASLEEALHDNNEFVRQSATLALAEVRAATVALSPVISYEQDKPVIRRMRWKAIAGWRQPALTRHHSLLHVAESVLAVVLVAGLLLSWVILTARLRSPAPGHHGHLGATVFTYQGGQSLEGYPVWSSDSQNMAFLSSFGFSVQVWNANSDNLTQNPLEPLPFTGLDTASGATWSPDGRHLAITSEDTSSGDAMVQVWDAVTGNNTLTLHSHASGLLYTAWSPGGKRLAFGGDDGIVHIWDPFAGQQILAFASHPGNGRSLSWSANGQLLLVGTPDGTFGLWNATTGEHVSTFLGATLAFFALSPDGRHMVSLGERGLLQVQDTITGGVLFTRAQPTGGISAIAWTPDSTRILTASAREVQVWDALTGRTILLFPYFSTSNNWQLSPDSRRLFTSNDSEVQFWSNVTGHTIRTFPDITAGGDWQLSPNGQYIAFVSIDNRIHVLDASSGQSIATYGGLAQSAEVLSWSPDSRRIASATRDGTVQVWDAFDGNNEVTYHLLSNAVTLSWSPDGHLIAAASEDNTLSVLQATR